jgi:hypothetical protein
MLFLPYIIIDILETVFFETKIQICIDLIDTDTDVVKIDIKNINEY